MEIPEKIDRFEIRKLIATGGMGEVYLGYDPICDREIALKRIRPHLVDAKGVMPRFLNEAKITAGLGHPSILPIYSIQELGKEIFYTMPFIEGETLKKILQSTRESEAKGTPPHEIGSSIPALIRIFHKLCSGVAYSHAKGILHRDIKPDNVMVGKFGEVVLLDWGIAEKMHEPSSDTDIIPVSDASLTQPGKIVGTIGYLAPERARGKKATIAADIYSLGALLYLLLTLRPPFKRTTIKEYRKRMDTEELLEPSEVAPYRDIPKSLANIAAKCLEKDPKNRFERVEDLLKALENYIEGKPGWTIATKLDVAKKTDWEFQENIPLTKDIALTRVTKEIQWVYLMLSKRAFTGNIKLEIELSGAHGLGFLLNVPNPHERNGLQDGYLVWLDRDILQVYRSNVQVLEVSDIEFPPEKTRKLVIEQIDNTIHIYLDDALIAQYISHIPLFGEHVGFFTQDMNFSLSSFAVHLGSYHIMVNCLAIPDAFLAKKDYVKALEEYRRIADSFTGRTEGREAVFRSGLTLIESAEKEKTKRNRGKVLAEALEEFEKLKNTPAAPLEYLGKSMVYASENDVDEEMKCFEIALRRYPNHPLMSRIEERIAYRLSECSKVDRKGAFYFALLALHHLPSIFRRSDEQRLLNNLIENLESPFFIIEPDSFSNQEEYYAHVALKLAFSLSKPHAFEEMLANEDLSPVFVQNGILSLLGLGYRTLAKKCEQNPSPLLSIALSATIKRLPTAIEEFLSIAPKNLSHAETAILFYLLQRGLTRELAPKLLPLLQRIDADFTLPTCCHFDYLSLKLWLLLLSQKWDACDKIFETIDLKELTREDTFFRFLYGCFLMSQEGKEIGDIFLSGVMETPYPPLHALLSHYLHDRLSKNWMKNAFYWEKRTLYRQLTLYYHCAGPSRQADLCEKKLLSLEAHQKSLSYYP